MKLYLIGIENGLDYSDYEVDAKLIVATDDSEALATAKEWAYAEFDGLIGSDPSYSAEAIEEVGGYSIEVSPKI